MIHSHGAAEQDAITEADMLSMSMKSTAHPQNGGVLGNKTYTNTTSGGKVANYTSSNKGYNAALNDFNSLNPNNVTSYGNGRIVGYLPSGMTINIHPGSSVGYTPSLEFYDPLSQGSIKIRY